MVVDYVRVYAPTSLPAGGANLLSNPGLEAGSLEGGMTYDAGFNTLRETIDKVPVREGTNVFKLFGQFNGSENFSGMRQNLAVAAGQKW